MAPIQNNDKPLPEYKIINEPLITAQKLLNQWKHEFNIDIISTEVTEYEGTLNMVILLTREKNEHPRTFCHSHRA